MLEPDRKRDDQSLLNAWRGGDAHAGALLFQRYYPSVARFFARKVGRDSDDLIQSTFLGCIEAMDRFRGEASFRALLFAIARNKLLKHIRERERDQRRFCPGEGPIRVAAPTPSAVTLAVARGEQQLLLTALAQLPGEAQLLLELHYWEDMPLREIAETVGLPLGTVKIRMHRARRRLAAALHATLKGSDPRATL